MEIIQLQNFLGKSSLSPRIENLSLSRRGPVSRPPTAGSAASETVSSTAMDERDVSVSGKLSPQFASHSCRSPGRPWNRRHPVRANRSRCAGLHPREKCEERKLPDGG